MMVSYVKTAGRRFRPGLHILGNQRNGVDPLPRHCIPANRRNPRFPATPLAPSPDHDRLSRVDRPCRVQAARAKEDTGIPPINDRNPQAQRDRNQQRVNEQIRISPDPPDRRQRRTARRRAHRRRPWRWPARPTSTWSRWRRPNGRRSARSWTTASSATSSRARGQDQVAPAEAQGNPRPPQDRRPRRRHQDQPGPQVPGAQGQGAGQRAVPRPRAAAHRGGPAHHRRASWRSWSTWPRSRRPPSMEGKRMTAMLAPKA